jgi:4-amino-4-deoxy-L-arabinose transferase-like glycosyltransferase
LELRHVHAVRLAGQVRKAARLAGVGVIALILLRAVMAGWLPLSADEAYYWLWSKHLAAGYYDHPPAIAFLIRLGTLLFGDNSFGVRFGDLVLSVLASWLVWRAAAIILKDETRAALSALLFNLTLMIGVEMLAATPDTPSIAATAGFLFLLTKLQQTGEARWWLWAGLAAGLGLLSKYSGFFVGAGGLLWLLANPKVRIWLRTPWPWLGGLLALLCFLPNLSWQARHDWMTFVFQFGRVTGGHLTARFLAEFIGAQLGLATPFILVLAGLGMWRARRPDDDRFLLLALIVPALAYFLIHALHDRVQGNWPCFLYPMLAILAADAFAPGPGWRGWCAWAAIPAAAAILFLAYVQAATGWLPLKNDPLARLLGVGAVRMADDVAALRVRTGAKAILTSDYETTAWLSFYRPSLLDIAVDQPDRYLEAPTVRLTGGPYLYVGAAARRQTPSLTKKFKQSQRLDDIVRQRNGQVIALYRVWRVEGPKTPIQGKTP